MSCRPLDLVLKELNFFPLTQTQKIAHLPENNNINMRQYQYEKTDECFMMKNKMFFKMKNIKGDETKRKSLKWNKLDCYVFNESVSGDTFVIFFGSNIQVSFLNQASNVQALR